jgi:hypothetical protein
MDLQTEKYNTILLTYSDCVTILTGVLCILTECVDVVDDRDCFYDVTVPISMYDRWDE